MSLLPFLTNLPHDLLANRFAGAETVFDWYPQQDTESPGRYKRQGFGDTPTGTVLGILVDVSQTERGDLSLREYRDQPQASMRRHLFVRDGSLASLPKPGDKLMRAATSYIVIETMDETGEQFAIRLVLEERSGV